MDASLKEKWNAIVSRNFAGQAKWFLNGFWNDHGNDAEQIWEYVQLCTLVDYRKGKEGNELDELEAHRFLERLGETLTVQDMRKKLRDIDLDFNKRMALIEYLIFKYNRKVVEVANAHQGGVEMQLKIAAAQDLVNQANIALDELSQRLESEKQALAYERIAEANCRRAEAEAVEAESSARETESSARIREQSAREREDAANAREAEARRADDENKAALAELQAQEEAFSSKKRELQAKADDASLGTVSRGKAKNELEQLKTTDPLPLQRAKLNQGATVRKSERAHLDAESARSVAERARIEAETARKAAEAARVEAERTAQSAATARIAQEKSAAEAALSVEATAVAREDAAFKLDQATNALEELKKIPDQSHGDIWWMEREIAERKKFLPKSKQ